MTQLSKLFYAAAMAASGALMAGGALAQAHMIPGSPICGLPLGPVTAEASDAQIRCALTRSRVETRSRAISIVSGDEEEEMPGVSFALTFEFDSAEPTAESAELLERIAGVVSGDPNLAEAAYFIDGHTDAVGEDAYNADLGQRRADAVKGFLLENGLGENTLEARSFGEAQLYDASQPEAEINRRVEITPVGASE